MECCNNKTSYWEKMKALLRPKKDVMQEQTDTVKKVALIGNPNVGKSVIFNSLTGAYVTVSNYPGTTVDISRGWCTSDSIKFEVTDTPGMYSMLPITEEERVTRRLLMTEKPDLVVHVVDAKNIARMLPLTLQLIESGFSVVLVLNIMDEAKALGIDINLSELQRILGIPVVKASAALNIGLSDLKKMIEEKIRNAA